MKVDWVKVKEWLKKNWLYLLLFFGGFILGLIVKG